MISTIVKIPMHMTTLIEIKESPTSHNIVMYDAFVLKKDSYTKKNHVNQCSGEVPMSNLFIQ